MCAIKCEVAPGVVGSLWELMIGQSSAVDDSHSVLGGGTGILAFSNCGQQFVTLWPGHRGRHTPTGRHLNKLILCYLILINLVFTILKAQISHHLPISVYR